MPRHKFARPCTVKTNQYAVAALKDRRATMAGEIQRFKQGIRDREEQLAHLDATLRILDPEYRAETIAPKRIRTVKLSARNGFAGVHRALLSSLLMQEFRSKYRGFPYPSINRRRNDYGQDPCR